MKHSIKRQMITVFLGLLTFLVLALLVINVKFLEPYYIRNKETQFINMYEKLNEARENGTLDNEEVSSNLVHLAEKNNISFLVEDERGAVYTNVHDKNLLKNQLVGYFLNQAQKESKILESTDEYQINQSWDPWNQNYYIEMWGTFDDGSQFLLRSPLESIRDSAALANNFLIYVGIAALILGSLFVWFFSRKITEPILELATLSRRMADLDFDARYTGKEDDEIGVLGQSFNTMSEKLEKTISELKGANIRLQKDIEQKQKMEEMRNEFLGNVSHELKTPIALIQGYAEGLKEVVNDDPESREFYCDVIMDEAGKMNQMVKNLLVLNQLEFGSDEVSMNRFDVVKLIRGVIASCEILIRQAEADVDFIADETAYVWADEFKTEQVIRNYLTNAIHHAAGEKRIEIRVISQENTVRISVFNTGTPIPDEDIGKIWDKFYKVDKAHTREYGGNGIGLSIVKAIMESFHQNYGVQNYQNGVEFWCELDAKSMAAPALSADAEEIQNEI